MKPNIRCIALAAFMLTFSNGGRAAEPMILTDTDMNNVTAGTATSEPFKSNAAFPEFEFSIIIPIFLTINSNNIAVSTSTSSANATNGFGDGTSPMSWFVPYHWNAQSGLHYGGFGAGP